jgi:hypothetical protein
MLMQMNDFVAAYVVFEKASTAWWPFKWTVPLTAPRQTDVTPIRLGRE